MKTLRRVLSYAKPYRWEFLGVLILGIFASSLQPGAALSVKPFLDDILVGKKRDILKMMPLFIICFAIFCSVSRYIYTVWISYLSERIVRTIRVELYKKYISLSLDYYSQASTGRMMSVINSDVILMLEAYGRINSLFLDPFTIIGLISVSFYRDWKLTLISLVMMPPLVLMISRIGKKLRKMTHQRQEQWATLNSTIHETLSGIRIVKAFGLEKFLHRKFRLDNERLLGVQFRWMKVPVLGILGGFGLAFLTVYGGNRVLSQQVSGGDIFSVGFALGFLIDPIKKLNSLYIGFQKGLAAATRVFSILDLTPSVENTPHALPLKTFSKNITFEQVSFKYKNEEQWVLRNINLTIQKGEVIALVGSSGGGKTTLVNLVPRFYDVTEGAISVDGMDVRDVTLESLSQQVALVSQDVFLFNDTVGANIAYGDQGRSQKDVVEAAKAAHAHDFIMELPHQYDTVVGERGVKLSGGERQRISIARALLKNAPILILDEATSALDTESEILVQKAIEQLMKGRTSFIIAHRLSTIQHAHRILVLSDGEIVEEGTHETLMKQEGQYHKFYQLQFSKQLGYQP